MKKRKNQKKRVRDALQESDLRRFVVTPLARRMRKHASAGMKISRRNFEKLIEIETLIEIIAREIARQSKAGK